MFLRDTNPDDERLMGHEIGLQEVTEYTGLWVEGAERGEGKKNVTKSLHTKCIRLKYVCVSIYIYMYRQRSVFTDTWLIFGGNLFFFFFPRAYLINHVGDINVPGLIGENYILYSHLIYLPISTPSQNGPNVYKHTETECFEKVVCSKYMVI